MNPKLRKITLTLTIILSLIAGGFWSFELYQQAQSVGWTFHGFEVLTIILFAVCALVGWVMIVKSGREVTIEYVLLGGLNDGVTQARALAAVCREMRCNVNLLLYNPVESLPYKRPTDNSAHRFLETVKSGGVNAHLRRSRGLDIEAACGQLRRRKATLDA